MALPPDAGHRQGQEETVLDTGVLVRLGEDTDPSALPTLIGTYRTHAHRRCETIARATVESDWLTVEQEAHALAASAAGFGLAQVSTVARELEAAARNEEEHRVPELSKRLQQSVSEADEALLSFLAGREA